MRTNTALCRATGALLAILAFAAAPAFAQVPVVDTTLVMDGNLFWDNPANFASDSGGGACPGGVYSVTTFATSYFHNVIGVNPLVNPQVYTLDNPRWDLQDGSPALAGNGADVLKASDLDSWFQDVCYLGGVGYTGGNDALDWTAGWTYYNQLNGTGRTDINLALPESLVTTNITANTTWNNTKNYKLIGRIGVNPTFTLTIAPGTVVRGAGSGSYLVIERDANLVAVGTRTQPIIFTSASAPGSQFPGDWGGVVIHGKAWSNCVGGCGLTNSGDCVSEGGAGNHGGTDDNDNSGIVKYARVEYGGFAIALNNELNNFTMNSVGRNTTLEYIQTVWGTDDNFEWFGGTARCRNFVAAYGADDNFDWQMGYRGFLQFGVVVQASTASTPGLDAGIEADNNEFNFNCRLQSSPRMANLTLVGTGPRAGGTRGLRLRRGTGGKIVNSIIQGWETQGLRLEDPETFANCAGDTVASLDCSVLAVGDLPVRENHLIVRAAPNPTAGSTVLSFNLPKESDVRVQVFSVSGRLVETLAQGSLSAGDHRIPWSGENVAPGLYFYQVVTESGEQARGKLVVTR